MVSIPHVESSENSGDEGLLAKTDAGTMLLTVALNAEKLVCRAVMGHLVLLPEPGLNSDRSIGMVFRVQH